MSLEIVITDTLEWLKQDSARTLWIKWSVQKGKIETFDSSILAELRDLLIRKASNGAEENYEVIDPIFIRHFMASLPATKLRGVSSSSLRQNSMSRPC